MTLSEDDRARAIAALREQVGSGALELDDYGVRLQEAYKADSLDELNHALRGLQVAPLSPPAAPQPPRPTATRPMPVSMPRPTHHSHPHPHKQPHQKMSPQKVEAAARAAWGAHLGAYLSVNLMLVVIWLLTGAGYPWPIWPAMGWGIGLAAHGMAHSAAMRHKHRPAE
jgi:hypothetical protein